MLHRIIESLYNLADALHASRLKRLYASFPIDFVFDVGSHKGEFVSLVVPKQTPVVLFEPQSRLHKTLKYNLRNHTIVALHEEALSNHEGSESLYVNALSSTTSLNAPNEQALWVKFKRFLLGGKLVEATDAVSLCRLDTLIEKNQYPEFKNALLKIDVEGHEAAVLEGAKKLLSSNKVQLVQLERARFNIYSDTQQNPASILAEHGFEKKASFLFPFLNFYDDVYCKVK